MIETELNSMQALQRLVVSGFSQWKIFGEVYTKALDDLLLFNYTPAAIANGRWTWLEQVSRGLIINSKTGEIAARPFDKFWNYSEGERYPAPGSRIVSIAEKMDGSMGTLFRHDGEFRIATRGSFESEQAVWATGYLQQNWRYLDRSLGDQWTMIFEIIYPDNRIVVDYGNRHDLVLLAVRNRHTGEYMPRRDMQALADSLEMHTAPLHTFDDMEAMLKATANIEHEGYVVEFTDGSRFKIKGARYLALHRIISQVSFNHVLDALSTGGWREYRQRVPEEFWPEIDTFYAEIMSVIDKYHAVITGPLTIERLNGFATRKDLAAWVLQQPRELQRHFFAQYDRKYKREDLFAMIERRSARTRVDRGEA